MIRLDQDLLALLYLQRPFYRGLSLRAAELKMEDEIIDLLGEPWMAAIEEDRSCLDIGCGIGFMTLAVARKQRFLGHHTMLDTDRVSHTYRTGYSDQPCGYNILDETRTFLSMNGIWNFQLCDIEQPLPERPFDLVVSNFAWGFHFPLSTYLDYVLRVVARHLYVTLREGIGGEALLEPHFELEWSKPGPKHMATLWRRRPA